MDWKKRKERCEQEEKGRGGVEEREKGRGSFLFLMLIIIFTRQHVNHFQK